MLARWAGAIHFTEQEMEEQRLGILSKATVVDLLIVPRSLNSQCSVTDYQVILSAHQFTTILQPLF